MGKGMGGVADDGASRERAIRTWFCRHACPHRQFGGALKIVSGAKGTTVHARLPLSSAKREWRVDTVRLPTFSGANLGTFPGLFSGFCAMRI